MKHLLMIPALTLSFSALSIADVPVYSEQDSILSIPAIEVVP